jgi:hypothetical protein
MRVGRLFTFNGHRYEPGSDFPIESLPAYRRTSFVRLYGLSEQPPKPAKKKKKTKPVEALQHFIPAELPEFGEQDE